VTHELFSRECLLNTGSLETNKSKLKMLLLQFAHLLSPSTTVSNVSTALEQLHISIFRQENVKLVPETSLLIKLNATALIIDKASLEFKVAP
jgi:hypothetical protein